MKHTPVLILAAAIVFGAALISGHVTLGPKGVTAQTGDPLEAPVRMVMSSAPEAVFQGYPVWVLAKDAPSGALRLYLCRATQGEPPKGSCTHIDDLP